MSVMGTISTTIRRGESDRERGRSRPLSAGTPTVRRARRSRDAADRGEWPRPDDRGTWPRPAALDDSTRWIGVEARRVLDDRSRDEIGSGRARCRSRRESGALDVPSMSRPPSARSPRRPTRRVIPPSRCPDPNPMPCPPPPPRGGPHPPHYHYKLPYFLTFACGDVGSKGSLPPRFARWAAALTSFGCPLPALWGWWFVWLEFGDHGDG